MKTNQFSNKPSTLLYSKFLLQFFAIVSIFELLKYLACQIINITYIFDWQLLLAFLCIYVAYLIFFSLTTLRNKYYVENDELIVKEFSLFSASKEQHIPLKSISSVNYISNVRWIVKHVEIKINNTTYMLWAVNYKKELYQFLVQYLNNKAL